MEALIEAMMEQNCGGERQRGRSRSCVRKDGGDLSPISEKLTS
jgi:hypothetical protein